MHVTWGHGKNKLWERGTKCSENSEEKEKIPQLAGSEHVIIPSVSHPAPPLHRQRGCPGRGPQFSGMAGTTTPTAHLSPLLNTHSRYNPNFTARVAVLKHWPIWEEEHPNNKGATFLVRPSGSTSHFATHWLCLDGSHLMHLSVTHISGPGSQGLE